MESEERYRLIIQNLDDIIYIIETLADPFREQLSFVNDQVEDILGYKPVEFLNNPDLWFSLLHPDDIPSVIESTKKIIRDKRSVTRYYRLRHKETGEYLYLEDKVVPTVKDNRVVGFMGVARDVTERKRTEERIFRINRLTEGLINPVNLDEKLKYITDSVVSIFDADFARIWVVRHGDLCDSGCFHAMVSEGPHICRQRDRCLWLVASSGRYAHIDGKVHRRVPFGCYKIGRVAAGERHKFITNDVIHDPEVHDHEWAEKAGLVSFAGYRLLSSSEKPIGVMALFSKHVITPDEDALFEGIANTTAQVIQTTIAVEGLRESEERYRALFEQAPDSILLVDGETGELVYFNDKAHQNLGYTREEFTKIRFHDFEVNESEENVQKHINNIIESGHDIFETKHRRKDGEIRDILVSCRAISLRGRHLSQSILTDITELRRSEDALRQAKEEIESWNRELERRVEEKTEKLKKSQTRLIQSEKLSVMGQLAAGLAHELNSPLAGLLPLLEKYRRKAEKGSEAYNELTLMLKAGEHMAKIVRDFGSFSRDDKGVLVELNLNEMIEDTLNFSAGQLKKRRIKIIREYAEGLPPINADRTGLQQVVLNMVANARDAMPGGGEIFIKTGFTEGGNMVTMEFTDNGQGISEEVLDKIFDPFFTTKKQGDGVGLGLSVSYGIIKKHNGEISVESTQGKGTRFTVVLPVINI